jgi:hypothetical protein
VKGFRVCIFAFAFQRPTQILELDHKSRMRVAQQLPLHRHDLSLQRFHLITLALEACRPGNIGERCRHQWIHGVEQLASDRQNFTSHRFSFVWLAFVAEKNT